MNHWPLWFLFGQTVADVPLEEVFEPPSMELLEYIGTWEEGADGQLLDPLHWLEQWSSNETTDVNSEARHVQEGTHDTP